MTQKIFYANNEEDVAKLLTLVNTRRDEYVPNFKYNVGATSCPGDPIHAGHLELLKETGKLAHTAIAIVNGDNFLLRKKGYKLLPIDVRAEIISYVPGIRYVLVWDDGTQSVAGALYLLKPEIFTKGGNDRARPEHIDPVELIVCQEINCKILYGIGGFNKADSSSKIVEQAFFAHQIFILKKEQNNAGKKEGREV